jgi:hypothetical protein
MIKKLLVPVMAFVALALPAGASIVEYCSGTSAACTTNNDAAFTATVAVDNITMQSLAAFAVGNLAANIYTDPGTGIQFKDVQGGTLSVSTGALSTPHSDDTIQIIIPMTYLAVSMTVNVTAGLCDNYCLEGETTGTLSFINNDSPSVPWIVSVSPVNGNGSITLSGFSAGTTMSQSTDTPEVATLLLIGFGLLSMRWMKRWPRGLFLKSQTA